LRIKGMVKFFGLIAIVWMLAGCDEEMVNFDREPNSVTGGPSNKPTEISLDLRNEIKKNAYYNYYKYRAKEGEKLSMDAILENAILKDQRIECQESGDTYIAVFDAKLNQLEGIRTCTNYLTVEFPVDGLYKFQIRYPGNKGYFNADSSLHP